jgi:tRNA (adenine22-N1)-methyltransferase
MKLTKRLQAISDLVPNNRKIIDVGSDHALLDIYLNKYKNCTCLAIDKSKYCTEKAIQNAEKYEANIKAITNDGLNDLKLNDEIIIISGLGTRNIIKILNKKINNDLIISSHTDINELKKFLQEKNYYIYREINIVDKKNYTLIYAKTTK